MPRVLLLAVLVGAPFGCSPEPDRVTPANSMSVDLTPKLPDLDGFRRAAQSLAALDAILSPEEESRYYSFDAGWGEGQMMASMRDGQGDQWFAIVTEAGVALHGLAHESKSYECDRPKPWVFAGLPEPFRECFLQEPAFDTDNSTFCFWRLSGDDGWSHGAKPAALDDGHAEQLAVLAGGAAAYTEWARDYYEVTLAPKDVAAVFQHEAITPELARRLNPDVDFEALQTDLREIGYL